HLHHRLLELGHSQRRAVGLMHAWTALIAFSAVSFAFVSPYVSLVCFLVGVFALAIAVFRPYNSTNRAT
ncbi:MAG: undecaprenyl-phosphate alpha-N-acetylglucosaminyl 1-phosphate transferase, partial [Actinomycetes bacterium]